MKEQILEMVKPLLDKYEWELKETEKYIRLYKSRDYTSWENTYTRDFRLYIGKNLDSKNRIKIKIQERLIKYCDRYSNGSYSEFPFNIQNMKYGKNISYENLSTFIQDVISVYIDHIEMFELGNKAIEVMYTYVKSILKKSKCNSIYRSE